MSGSDVVVRGGLVQVATEGDTILGVFACDVTPADLAGDELLPEEITVRTLRVHNGPPQRVLRWGGNRDVDKRVPRNLMVTEYWSSDERADAPAQVVELVSGTGVRWFSATGFESADECAAALMAAVSEKRGDT